MPMSRHKGCPPPRSILPARTGVFRDRCWRIRKDGTRFCAEVIITRIEGDGIAAPGGLRRGFCANVTSEDFQARSLEANAVLARDRSWKTIPEALVGDRHQRPGSAVQQGQPRPCSDYAASEVIGRDVRMLMPEQDRKAHDVQMRHYRRTGESRK